MRTHARAAAATALTAVVALTLSACGGGSSDDASPTPDTTPEATAEPTTVESAVEEDLRDIEVTEDTDPALIRASLLQQWDDQSAEDQQLICEGYGMLGSLVFSDINEDGSIPESMVPVVMEQFVSIVEEKCDLENGPDRVVSEGRENPVKLGVPVNVVSTSWEGEVLSDAEVTLGEADWSAAANIETYSDEEAVPEPGTVFVTVPVTVTLTATDQATPVEPDYTFDLSYVAPDGRTFQAGGVQAKDSITHQPSLFPGATATGDVALVIPEDALGEGAVWMLSPWVSASPVPTFVATH